jgi:hypothetical protein
MESPPMATQPARRKPFKVPGIFAQIFIPLLFIVGAISIPWVYVQKSRQRRRERRFADQMKKAGRLMQWREFKQAIANSTGTAIGEYLSMKGPFRLWWTLDDIPATSPHEWKREHHFALIEAEFLPFFQWCYARYTSPRFGLAQLVPIPEEEQNQLKSILENNRFVSTYSFRLLRESHTAKTPD